MKVVSRLRAAAVSAARVPTELASVGGASAAPVAGQAKIVTVTLSEWKLGLSPKRVPAGKVTFVIRNKGKLVHEFVLTRTNVAPAKLATSGGVAKVKPLAAVRNIGPGQTKRVTVTLGPAKHVLLSNLPAHYQSGQYAGLVVGS